MSVQIFRINFSTIQWNSVNKYKILILSNMDTFQSQWFTSVKNLMQGNYPKVIRIRKKNLYRRNMQNLWNIGYALLLILIVVLLCKNSSRVETLLVVYCALILF